MRFNQQATGTKTTNVAGGQAYTQSPELELVSILLTNFGDDSFYRKASASFDRLKYLIGICDKEFVAKAIVYARTQFGMRSITHVAASELSNHTKGQQWAKNFYKALIYRPDDMMETLSYHKSKGYKLTNPMRKGFAAAFDKFDAYSLAKYRAQDKEVKLVDIVNLVHPTPTERNQEALTALITGKLKSFDTWESMLSSAGSDDDAKKEVWAKLLTERKIKYFALLRNLRNIVDQAPEMIDLACELLTDEAQIKRSLVLPFRFLVAYNAIASMSNPNRKVLVALNKAIDLSVSNIPKFEGSTLVVLDVSGSMKQMGKGEKSPHIIGTMFAAAMAKANNCDLMTFDSDARFVAYNPMDSVLTIANGIKFTGGSTNFHSIFQRALSRYDRIVILSDMQGWVGYNSPVGALNEYRHRTNADPIVYSFDLANYGTAMFPERNILCLAGFSEKVFDIMSLLEQDRKALVNTISSSVTF